MIAELTGLSSASPTVIVAVSNTKEIMTMLVIFILDLHTHKRRWREFSMLAALCSLRIAKL
jgi:hypothetical protein